MILILPLSDRNHTEDSLNGSANVLEQHDQNFDRLSMIDKRFLQVLLASLS